MDLPNRIVHTKLLLVEGQDEFNFFDKMLTTMNISGIQIIEVGGKDQFHLRFPVLTKIRDFSNVVGIGILRDADDNAQGAFKSICLTVKKCKYIPPNKMGDFGPGQPSIGIFIIPDNKNKGMLEDLCLDSVGKNSAMKCVDVFEDCITKLKNKPNNISKSKALAYLAAMPKDCIRVGEAAFKNYWDFGSSVMTPLKGFLKKI